MIEKIRIGIVAPPFGPTGGPEVMVNNLTEALIEMGAKVTLFAPADWKTSAEHIVTLPKSLWAMKSFKNQTEKERRELILASQLKAIELQENFDILHFHQQRHIGAIAKLAKTPCVLTFHSKITPDIIKNTKKYNVYTVALSERHRRRYKVSAIIRNGISVKEIEPSFKKGSYLISIGRIAESKGIDTAIEIAREASKKLLIIGRIGVSKERKAYFDEKIKPFLSDRIIFKDEVSQKEMFKYLRKAEALLFPIRPARKSLAVCPLVVMESLACGTPVIGTIIMSPEDILKKTRIACLSNNKSVLIKGARDTKRFERVACRKYAEKNFSRSIMAKEYLALYKKIVRKEHENI